MNEYSLKSCGLCIYKFIIVNCIAVCVFVYNVYNVNSFEVLKSRILVEVLILLLELTPILPILSSKMYSGTLALFSSTSSSGVANREVGLEGNYGLNEQPSGNFIYLKTELIN